MKNLKIDLSVVYLNFLREGSVYFRNKRKESVIILSVKSQEKGLYSTHNTLA